MNDIAQNLKHIHERVRLVQKHYNMASQPVTLVAVSKNQPADVILRAIEAGQRVFGENKVQEALKKWPRLKEQYPDIVLHLIGPLQTNKVKQAVQLFDVIETVDREKIVQALASTEVHMCKKREYYVQVNIGNEEQKAGIAIDKVDTLMSFSKEMGLNIKGMMCIPPAHEVAAPYFALLAKIAKHHCLSHVSMGMSADFESAIALGATHIRVGTAIFGERIK